jgi:hypothetical protein
MSMDLVVLPPENARDYEQALGIYYEEIEGESAQRRLEEFLEQVSSVYAGNDWPWTMPPVLTRSHVLFGIVYERWEEVASVVTRLAHERGLAVLDPQEETLATAPEASDS